MSSFTVSSTEGVCPQAFSGIVSQMLEVSQTPNKYVVVFAQLYQTDCNYMLAYNCKVFQKGAWHALRVLSWCEACSVLEYHFGGVVNP